MKKIKKIFKMPLLLLLGYISTVLAAIYPTYNWIINKIKRKV